MESKYLIPTDEATVEVIAKAIARDRMRRDAANLLRNLTGMTIPPDQVTDKTVDKVFETLWNGVTTHDEIQRQNYREDAIAAIRAMNLKLLTSIP